MKALAMITCIVALGANAADTDWERFRQSFVQPDGRVVDTGQARISHSEGQGFTMLFAVHPRTLAAAIEPSARY